MQYPDHEILAALQAGGRRMDEVLEFLYKEPGREGIRGAVIHLVTQKGGSFDEAKEILHIAIMEFWEKVQFGPPLDSNLKVRAYIRTIARNCWYDQIRKSGSKQMTPVPDEHELPQPLWETPYFNQKSREGTAKRAKTVLNRLGKLCRRLLEIHFLYDHTLQEVKEEMEWDISVQAVFGRKKGCVKGFRELWDETKEEN